MAHEMTWIGTAEEPGEFRVIVRDAVHFSIWSAAREIPPKWSDTGIVGSKADCSDAARRMSDAAQG